ncbi:MAG: glycosyltransferase family A protein [Actinomycetota bacterium]
MDWLVDLATAGSPLDLALYAIGWTAGWLLLTRPRRLPPGGAARRPCRIVIPARDEAHQLPHLVPPLVAQLRPGDTVVVVDDHSTDATGSIAASLGAEVVTPPPLPDGWRGKPHACHVGAAAGSEPTLVFIDADVRPGPTLVDDLVGEVEHHPGTVVSVQPWHDMPTASEQASLIANVTALMGCGAFTAVGDRTAATVAFGPVLAVDRVSYERRGGHADPVVRTMHTEDIGLARLIGRSRLFVGSADSTRFRMYPGGIVEAIRGWTRSIATGARFTSIPLAIATLAWVWSLAGGWWSAPIVYPLSVLQVAVLGRVAGTTRWWAAVAFPLLVLVFVVIFVRSAAALVLRQDVTWKGRAVPSRPR